MALLVNETHRKQLVKHFSFFCKTLVWVYIVLLCSCFEASTMDKNHTLKGVTEGGFQRHLPVVTPVVSADCS